MHSSMFNLITGIIDHQIGSIINISQELRPLAETNNIRTIEKFPTFYLSFDITIVKIQPSLIH